MTSIVAIHGIGQQYKGEDVLHSEWLPALLSGLRRADSTPASDDLLACEFYGDLFRKVITGAHEIKSYGDPPYNVYDLDDDLEKPLLLALWEGAERSTAAQSGVETKGRTPAVVQQALRGLSANKFFAGIVERAFIGDLKQVRLYLRDDVTRRTVRARVEAAVTDDTRIVIGHSLGSIVAYETLCSQPEWNIELFLTLGSPLGIQNVIFDNLDPAPIGGRGVWPTCVKRWVNIADNGDLVALVKELRSLFGGSAAGLTIEDERVHNGATAHDVRPYLTDVKTGTALAEAISRCRTV